MEQLFPKGAMIAKSRYFNSAESAADAILEHRSIIQDSGEALISRNSGRRILITLQILKAFKFGFRILLSRNILWGFSPKPSNMEQLFPRVANLDQTRGYCAKEVEIEDSKFLGPKPFNMEQFFPKAALIAKLRYFNSAENADDVMIENCSITHDSGEALIFRNSGRRILITLQISKGFQIGFPNTAV
ncbi:hypothetical protein CDAR_21811 [Caerostris darwini]|uniref:Uncharacterized protein n=1 Tax=Caerostris darwini TaxID=1538125 RepID=A0AAV4TMS8_9ARAC|nr:hypothetical protein CDAR_21811 [Caerostris darwini]